MNDMTAFVYRNYELGIFYALFAGSDTIYTLPNNGIGYELQEKDEIMIQELDEENHDIIQFEKVRTEYVLEENEYGFEVYKKGMAGEKELKREWIEVTENTMKELPGDIKIKMIFYAKKQNHLTIELVNKTEEIEFSIQNGQSLVSILEEFKDYAPELHLDNAEAPYIVVSKNGIKKRKIMNWNKEYQTMIFEQNDLPIPIEIAEKKLREIQSEDLLLSDIILSEEGDIVIIKGIKYYFKDKKSKEKLKELNPLLYEKICKVIAGEMINKETKETWKKKYKAYQAITEEGELEQIQENHIDRTTLLSLQKYMQKISSMEYGIPVYRYIVKDEEILFYLGEETNISLYQFKEIAKEILQEQLKETNELKGWDAAEETVKQLTENRRFKTIGDDFNFHLG